MIYLARVSPIEVVGIVFTIITGIVLALFAFAAAYVQRATYIRGLYRRVDFASGSLDIEGSFTDEEDRRLLGVVIRTAMVNQNPEPIEVVINEPDIQATLFGTFRVTDLAINVNAVKAVTTVIPAGATFPLSVYVTLIPHTALEASTVEVNLGVRVSALPDDLSRVLLPRTKGYRWVNRPIEFRFDFDTHQWPTLLAHNLTFVDVPPGTRPLDLSGL